MQNITINDIQNIEADIKQRVIGGILEAIPDLGITMGECEDVMSRAGYGTITKAQLKSPEGLSKLIAELVDVSCVDIKGRSGKRITSDYILWPDMCAVKIGDTSRVQYEFLGPEHPFRYRIAFSRNKHK